MTLGYWIESPGRGALRDVDVAATDDAALELEAVCSGVSPGTERLVGLGRVPASLHASMACRGMQGTFSLPLLYGYSFVGRVRGGDDAGTEAFVTERRRQESRELAHAGSEPALRGDLTGDPRRRRRHRIVVPVVRRESLQRLGVQRDRRIVHPERRENVLVQQLLEARAAGVRECMTEQHEPEIRV